jgi:hypothetical protein
MRIYCFLIIVCGMLFQVQNSYAQNLATPAEGKSMVYFVRSSGTGALVNFKYFDGESYLGKFSGLNYFILECDPGKHVFWVTSENRDFVEAELLPDKVYFIEVRPTVGAVKAAVKLFPVSSDNQKATAKLYKILTKKEPLALTEKDFSGEGESLEFYIRNGLKKYESDKEKGKAITQLPSTFFHN